MSRHRLKERRMGTLRKNKRRGGLSAASAAIIQQEIYGQRQHTPQPAKIEHREAGSHNRPHSKRHSKHSSRKSQPPEIDWAKAIRRAERQLLEAHWDAGLPKTMRDSVRVPADRAMQYRTQ